MQKVKTISLVVIPLIVLILVCFLYAKTQDKVSMVYQAYVKLDSLILFNFDDTNNPLITSYSLEDENDLKLFSNINFNGMSLEMAIEEYLKIEKNNGVTLNNVYIWTNWDNENYFNGKNYKLNILDDKTLDKVLEITKPKLLYNHKYYKVGDEHNYNIVIKEDGSLEYHVDEYTTTICDEYIDDSCFEATIDDEYYKDASNSHTYSLSDGIITIKYKKDKDYFGWVYSYDECEIMYNALKCNYYNGYHEPNPVYRHTVYYELKQ